MNKQKLSSQSQICLESERGYSLSPAQIESYRQQGHLVVPQALNADDVADYRPFISEAANQELAKLDDSERAVGTSGTKFVYDMREVDRTVWLFITSKTIAKIAAELLGVDQLRLLHYNCFFKPPKGRETPWHQDCLYIPLNTDKVITAWIPLVKLSSNMGLLTFASRSHRLGFCKFANSNKYSWGQITQMLQDREFQVQNVGSMAVGDISFHSSFTLHSSPKNLSNRMREVIAISYYADGACIGEPENLNCSSNPEFSTVKYREHFLNQYFSGLKLGDLARSPINPLVFETNG